MSPPTTLSFIQRSIFDLIGGMYFGATNPLPTLICLPGIILENPKLYIKFASIYGSIFGAVSTLVTLGFTLRYSIKLIKKFIAKRKHRKLTTAENKLITSIGMDTKKHKKVSKRNILHFLKRKLKRKT